MKVAANSMSLLIKTPWAVKCFASMLECHCWAPAAHSPDEHTQALVASNHVLQTFCKGLHALHTGQEIRWHLKHELCCLSDCIFPTSDLTQECCGDSIQNLEWNLLRSQLDTRNKIKKKKSKLCWLCCFHNKTDVAVFNALSQFPWTWELGSGGKLGKLGLRNALFAC